MSALRTKTETLACAWCGNVEAVPSIHGGNAGGGVSPVSQSRGVRIPPGWLHVYANLDPDTSDVSIFVVADEGEGLGVHWVCSSTCQAESEHAVQIARVGYVEAWDAICPRRKKKATS
ncbi:hypothetical protein LCGC14_1474280 [marine sediment metagenome]|uniref:Uncharacterized protein n=1 Tax=marine sediment metagenome TaxID=412755 RepID=A0A0F9LRW8_9ZZZZ